jgi:hypothetical protein
MHHHPTTIIIILIAFNRVSRTTERLIITRFFTRMAGQETGRSAVRGVAALKLPFSTIALGASVTASPANWINSKRVSFERALR